MAEVVLVDQEEVDKVEVEVEEEVVAMVVVVVGSGWLSSIDNKVTFPWEAAWGSRVRPPSRAAGPPPLREETTEGRQPAGGGREVEGREQVKPGAGQWNRKEEGRKKAPLEVLSTGSERVREECGQYGEEKNTRQFPT